MPLVIASPSSRGGYVCSQVLDHTSLLQFLEVYLSHKSGRSIRETNISAWRRTVCGDLTCAFRPWNVEKLNFPDPVQRDPFLISINEAQSKPMPGGMATLTAEQIDQVRHAPRKSPLLARQESGVRPACALPYELATDGALASDGSAFVIQFAASRQIFGERAAGAPFRVYTPEKVRAPGSGVFEVGRSWDYAVAGGDQITDRFPLQLFETETYHLCVYGPNGFFREFRGRSDDPQLAVTLFSTSDSAALQLVNRDLTHPLTVTVEDQGYGSQPHAIQIRACAASSLDLNLEPSFGWYDLRIRVAGFPHYEQRYTGHVETGRASFTDPFMGTSCQYGRWSAIGFERESEGQTD